LVVEIGEVGTIVHDRAYLDVGLVIVGEVFVQYVVVGAV
jgi:hypothetical protein